MSLTPEEREGIVAALAKSGIKVSLKAGVAFRTANNTIEAFHNLSDATLLMLYKGEVLTRMKVKRDTR
jgi:hypothetical protein